MRSPPSLCLVTHTREKKEGLTQHLSQHHQKKTHPSHHHHHTQHGPDSGLQDKFWKSLFLNGSNKIILEETEIHIAIEKKQEYHKIGH